MSELRVLQLVTTPRPFFRQQVQALEDRGIECTTVAVPADRGGRGPTEYFSFVRQVLGEGLSGYDLVHANYGLVGPVALAQPTRPVVLTLWGSDLMGGGWLSRWSRFAARASDTVVVPSEVMARELSVPHVVIPFPVDMELFHPIDRETAREQVGWDPDGRVVLFPYDPDRQVKDYTRAKELVDQVPDTELRVVNGVPYESMPNYMNASDALLVSSRRESGPMVVREAAACNVPVVSTPVGFAPQVLEGVANSAVAGDDDELVAALEIAVDAGRSDGRETVDSLAPADVGAQLAETYKHALR